MKTPALRLPKSWADLTDKELRFIYSALDVAQDQMTLKVMFFFHVNNMVLYGESEGLYTVLWGRHIRYIPCDEMRLAILSLRWMDTPPSSPVVPRKISGKKTPDPRLRELPFGEWLAVDNLFSGFLATQRDDLLMQAAAIILKKKKLRKFSKADSYAVFFWIFAVKTSLSREFPTLFPEAETDEAMKSPAMIMKAAKESTNGMLRALTRADITKEDAVMKVPMYRAFAELEALSKEAEELKRQEKSK